MTKYFLHGKLIAKAGQGEKLASILLDASRLLGTARGCIIYAVGRDKSDTNSIWVTEIWDSKEDHDASLTVEGVRELIAQAMPILEQLPQKGQELDILGGKGV